MTTVGTTGSGVGVSVAGVPVGVEGAVGRTAEPDVVVGSSPAVTDVAVPEPQDASEISIDRMRRRGNKREISDIFMKHSFPGVAGRSSIDMLNGWDMGFLYSSTGIVSENAKAVKRNRQFFLCRTHRLCADKNSQKSGRTS